MEFDDRPPEAQRLQKAREKRFKTPKEAARFHGWVYETYIQHEQGTRGLQRQADKYARAFGVSRGWLLTGEGEAGQVEVPIMGYVGAGGDVDPDFEQVPPDGLSQVTLPFAVPDEMIAFKVTGISMMPVYRDGTVIVVYREQRRALETFFGEEAAVRTADGKRFIKQIMRGQGNAVTLASWNADPIENQRVEWIGEIFAVIPPSALRRAERQGGVQGQLQFKKSA